MEYHKPASFLAALLLIGTTTLYAAESGRIYRYTDDKGQTAFNSYIPAEFVKNGYAILNHRGRVLEEFPPVLARKSPAEETAQQEQQRLEAEARVARKEADNILLRVYRSPEDIERRRDLNLSEFDSEIAAKTAALEQLDAEIAQLEPGSTALTRQKRKRDELDTEVLTLEAKRENAAYGFEEDIERLKYLQRIAKDTAAY
jgi:hypothetical protein